MVPRQLQPHRKKQLSHKQQLVTPLGPCKNRDNVGEKVGGLPFLLEPSEDEEDLAPLWSYLWWRAEGLRVGGSRVEGWRVGDQGLLVWATAMGTVDLEHITFSLAEVVIHDSMRWWVIWCFRSIDCYWLVG